MVCNLNYYNSRFWQRIYVLTTSIFEGKFFDYKRDHQKAEMAFKSICWTNVFKISSKNGNPPNRLIQHLLEIEEKENLFIEDIKSLKPNIIIFSTGSPYDEYLRRLLPGLKINEIDKGENDIAKLNFEDFDGLAIRTTHFQRLSNRKVERVFEFVKKNYLQRHNML